MANTFFSLGLRPTSVVISDIGGTLPAGPPFFGGPRLFPAALEAIAPGPALAEEIPLSPSPVATVIGPSVLAVAQPTTPGPASSPAAVWSTPVLVPGGIGPAMLPRDPEGDRLGRFDLWTDMLIPLIRSLIIPQAAPVRRGSQLAMGLTGLGFGGYGGPKKKKRRRR